jgi:hypothetical protein
LNVFDLILLEYPYGVWVPTSYSSAVILFLKEMKSVRPVPYVRGDWFLEAITHPPLYPELVALLGLPKGIIPPPSPVSHWLTEEVTLEEAAAELGLASNGDKVAGVLAQPKYARTGLAALADKKKIPRSLWEKHYSEVMAGLDLGTPILPLDGLTCFGYNADPQLGISLNLGNFPTGKIQDVFKMGDLFEVQIKSNRNAHGELIYAGGLTGNKYILASKSLEGGKIEKVNNDNQGYPIEKGDKPWKVNSTPPNGPTSPPQGADLFIVFAIPEAGPGFPKNAFPKGEVLAPRKGIKGVQARVLHPFYSWTNEANKIPFSSPGQVVKVTLSLTEQGNKK